MHTYTLAHVVDWPATVGCSQEGELEKTREQACASRVTRLQLSIQAAALIIHVDDSGKEGGQHSHPACPTFNAPANAPPCAMGKRRRWRLERRRGEWLHGSDNLTMRGPGLLLPASACPMKGLRFLMGRRLNLRRRAPAREANPGSAAPISDGDAGTGGSAGLLGGQGPPVSTNTTPLPETRRPCPLHTCSSGQPTLESP